MPHALRSDITRASFHALEGDAALVAGIAARIDAALAGYAPADAPALSDGIGEALHQVALPRPREASGPLGRLVALRRNTRAARLAREAREARRALPARHPELAHLFCCDPDPAVRAAALAVLPAPPSPVHAALAGHARTLADGDPQCISD